ncbi:MAG: hypothetical protein H0W69_01300 [Gemmatimonadaceae bacterium]|nr:hypothetical protein [Gemmatimonadaceae bacterium]
MILYAGIALLVVWLLGFLLLKKVVGGIIHLVLLVAIIAIAWHFLAGA